MKKALIVVDVQNDFLPGGSLPVAKGDEVIPVIDQLLKLPFDIKVATKDWHPSGHVSFASSHNKKIGEHIQHHHIDQILWPDHCIQGSFGAEFAIGIDWSLIERTFYKGTDKHVDSYSALFDNEHLKSTGLLEYLKRNEIKEIFVAGLSTDYCVKYSVLDALKANFKTHIIVDACRAVNLADSDEALALNDMKRAGAILNYSKQIHQSLIDNLKNI